MTLPIELQNIEEDIRRQVGRFGAEVLDVQFRRMKGRNVITFTVDKPEGVTLDECTAINNALGAYLDDLAGEDEEPREPGGEFFRGAYTLEVNSPGLDRPLKSAEDFRRALGKEVRVFFRSDDGRMLDFRGKVSGVGEGKIEFTTDREGKTVSIAAEAIAKAVREIDFK